jgi:hypothetical protein
MRLGIIARSDNTGLGNQTRELVEMLNPSSIMLINSESFNGNKQHPEWYNQRPGVMNINGFPIDREVIKFLRSVDVVISCETFYNDKFLRLAKDFGVKTILQYNYEFLGVLQKPELGVPDVMLAPSSWNINEVINKFGQQARVVQLPPPTSPETFGEAKAKNMGTTHRRILHIAGKKAARDRNGTETVIEMLKHSTADYELVIQTQTGFHTEYKDPRLTIKYENPENRQEMYAGYDAMILPRRYAGLCLPMNEALLSGLPVFMTNISPNDAVLPDEWLASASKKDQFMAKTLIDVYDGDPREFAKIVDDYVNSSSQDKQKQKAFDIGYSNFAVDELKNKYLEIIKSLA